MPSIEIHAKNITFDIGINSDTNLKDGIDDISNSQTFGSFGIENMTTTIVSGKVEISAH